MHRVIPSSRWRSGPFAAATADARCRPGSAFRRATCSKASFATPWPSYDRVKASAVAATSSNYSAANCTYNGPRWFSGDNETKADPNAGNVAGSGDATDNNNAGELPGVVTIQAVQSYTQVDAGFRTSRRFCRARSGGRLRRVLGHGRHGGFGHRRHSQRAGALRG